MESSGTEFPGFQASFHKDEFEYRRVLSRLQMQAPRPLQIKSNTKLGFNGDPEASSSTSMAPTSSFNPFYHNKDPIPLLSPLVLPSLFDHAFSQQENTATSR
ncbi:hypothetical protein K2173_017152 [Erythroxylum novogranatense]|uniref:Uncharacterized protein n=1 Tax=Erythroxylum novogranatense TaxID=1862640 RepID=A0AAV8U730_9ROSI|nr:hypothetical protein K2173_017152 [Erythroxylum novogranatense]